MIHSARRRAPWPAGADPGRRSAIQCPTCLSYNDSEARFCSQCGTPLAADALAPPGGRSSVGNAARPAAAHRSEPSRFKRAILFILILAVGVVGGTLLYDILGPFSGGNGQPQAPAVSTDGDGETDTADTTAAQTSDIEDIGSGAEELPALPPSPDALMERVSAGLFLFVGLDEKGEEFVRCAAVATPHGLALPARCLLGSELAWIRDSKSGGFEIEGILFFDALLGTALASLPDGLKTLPGAGPAGPAMGDRIYLVRPGDDHYRAAIVPGLFGGSTYDPDTGADRGIMTGAAAGPLGGAVVDHEGRLLGIAPPGGEEDAVVYIPVFLFDPGGRGGLLTLSDFNAIYYKGSFEALLREARVLARRGLLSEALQAYDSAVLEDPRRGAELDEEILNIILDLACDLMDRNLAGEALLLLSGRAGIYPGSVELMKLAFRAAAAAGNFPEANQWMARVGGLDAEAFRKLQGEHVKMFLNWSEELLVEGRRRAAAGVIRDGIHVRPASSALHEALGKHLKSLRDFHGAAMAFQEAVRLDPTRAAALHPLIQICAELQASPDAVVLDFDPQGPIRCRGLLNGKVWVNFIVDTGASYTSIPAAAAESLGIRVDRMRKTRITTANGEKAVPYFILGSLDVSGLVLKDSFALVNDLPPPDESYGLLGLNFLDKYHYTVDHQSGRMVLRKK